MIGSAKPEPAQPLIGTCVGCESASRTIEKLTRRIEKSGGLCSDCATIQGRHGAELSTLRTSRDEGQRRERGLSKRIAELDAAGREYTELTDPVFQQNEELHERIAELEKALDAAMTFEASAEMACESPCGDCAGCNLANERNVPKVGPQGG